MWLAEAGVYNFKNRVYSPALGRFSQTDPAGYGSGANLYVYVLNDPINLTDPRGLQQDAPGGPGSTINGTCQGGPFNGQDCSAIPGLVDLHYDPTTGNLGQYYYNNNQEIYFAIQGNIADLYSLTSGGYQPDLAGAACGCPNPRFTLYRVVDQRELNYIVANGNYGHNLNRSGKYFALTQQGALNLIGTSIYPTGTLTSITVPEITFLMGHLFPDAGGAGPSIFYDDEQLIYVYRTMTPIRIYRP